MEYLRIYGKRKEIAPDYWEIQYREYREDGSLKMVGTEDFSTKRMCKYINAKCVFTWDGQKRNKGGKRFFDYHGIYRYTGSNKQLKAYIQTQYPKAELIDLR